MKENIVFCKENSIEELAQVLKDIMQEKDVALVTGIVGGINVKAPSSRKPNFMVSPEIYISPDVIANKNVGTRAIAGMVALVFVRTDELSEDIKPKSESEGKTA